MCSGAPSGLQRRKQQKSFSRRDSPEVCADFRVLELMRAQGKPDASRIRWPRTQKAERYELTSPQDEPSIRLSLHDGLYGLCLICSGQPAASPVASRPSCDLAVRPDGFANARLDASAPAHFGFAVRFLPRPSRMAATDRFIRDRVPRPRDQTDMPEAVSVHRIPARASDDGQRPSRPERFGLYTRRCHCVKRKLRQA